MLRNILGKSCEYRSLSGKVFSGRPISMRKSSDSAPILMEGYFMECGERDTFPWANHSNEPFPQIVFHLFGTTDIVHLNGDDVCRLRLSND